MGKLKNNQSGFSSVEGILILVIVAIVSFTGWYVYNSNKKTNANYNSANAFRTTSTPSFKKKVIASTGKAPSAIQKYLTITEWSVKAPYSGTDTLTYKLNDSKTSASIISKQLSDSYGCTSYGAGIIARYAPTDQAQEGPNYVTPEQAHKDNPTIFSAEVGAHYFSFVHDQAACGNISAGPLGQPTAGEQAQTIANKLTQSLIPNIQAIPQ